MEIINLIKQSNKTKYKFYLIDISIRNLVTVLILLIFGNFSLLRKKNKLDNYSVIVICKKNNIHQQMRNYLSRYKMSMVVPLNVNWILDIYYRKYDIKKIMWDTTPDVNYIARSNLDGNYVEFGTWWGKSFYENFFKYQKILTGKFYAFDSFCGLPDPSDNEKKFTANDFSKGNYYSSLKTFEMIGELSDADFSKIITVPGFYNKTLSTNNIKLDNLKEQSVAICYIDCDLYESTKDVLEFITPYLINGSLIYFDDYRLSRASPYEGEKGALDDFIKNNPVYDFTQIDLIKSPKKTHSWQGQWFIFNRI